MPKKKYAFCRYCMKPIMNPKRKSMDSLYYTIWIVIIIATLGIALIPFLIIRYLKKKAYCPDCQSVLEFYETPYQFPDQRPPIEHVFE
ncbi:MAG: hypothetical protein EU539_10330, partial [Promethearchaeota archaeon]